MGCGNTKTAAFEGTADAEIQHYCHILGELAGYNWEQGAGPIAKTDEALRNIIRIADANSTVQEISVDLYNTVVEALRGENNQLFQRFIVDINRARLALCAKVAIEEPDLSIYDTELNNLWVPRVVRLDPGSVYHIGSSVDVGITGAGASVLGFCVEAWIQVLVPLKKGPEPAISLLATEGATDMQPGSCPNFTVQQDGKIVMDFFKCPCPGKKTLVEGHVWTHVAFVYGQGLMKTFVNGRRVGERQAAKPWGEVALSMRAFVPVDICEYRVWSVDRSDLDISQNMSVVISPISSCDERGLRLSWLPLKVGCENYTPGALLYDTWRRVPVGCRVNPSKVLDCRWPCAIPGLLSATLMKQGDHLVAKCAEEHVYIREKRQLALHAGVASNVQLPKQKYDIKAELVTLALSLEGAPWIPRIVTLPPGVHANIGTSAEFGISMFPSDPSAKDASPPAVTSGNSFYSSAISGFTIELWVRIRALLPGQDNCIIGYGTGAPVSVGQSMHIVLRDGRPLMGFMGNPYQVEADNIIIPPMQWTHLAFTCDRNGVQSIFANGIMIGNHQCPVALFGNCTLTLGACGDGNYLLGDVCELRIWSRCFDATDVLKYMAIAIPPLAGQGHRDLRISWLPLRQGGPISQQIYVTQNELYELKKDQKEGNLTGNAAQAAATASAENKAAAGLELSAPCPTLLWDVTRKMDVGRLTNVSVLLTTRTRVPPVPSLVPPDQYLPPHWSKSAFALVDEWSDAFDRMFVASWPPPPLLDQHGLPMEIPASAGAAVARQGPWIPRVIRYKVEVPLSCKVGTTAEMGVGSIGAMDRQFTLELWVRPRALHIPKGKIICQDFFGHEDADSEKGTLLFGLGRPEALRIGLANGIPFMTFGGGLKSLKPGDIKDCGIIAPHAIPTETWTHLSFAVDGQGVMRITIDGKAVMERNKIGALKAKGDLMLYAFGYPGRECYCDVTEMRMWSACRSEQEVSDFMHLGLTPLDTGGPRVPGLRLCWFPLRSMRSVMWDTKMLQHRVCYHDISRDKGPQMTRRPNFIPPHILNSLVQLPCAPVLDDRGDAFERVFLPDLMPKVVRHKAPNRNELGDVDYTAIDWKFLPFDTSDPMVSIIGKNPNKKEKPKSSGLGLAATKTRKEKDNIDIGWRDSDDGTWAPNSGFDEDDGGYIFNWGGAGDLEKEVAMSEVIQMSGSHDDIDVSTRLNSARDELSKKDGSAISNAPPVTTPKSIASTTSNSDDLSIPAGVAISPIKERPNAELKAAVITISVANKVEHHGKLPPLESTNKPEVQASNPKKRNSKSSQPPVNFDEARVVQPGS
jgi:hypothetical protein